MNNKMGFSPFFSCKYFEKHFDFLQTGVSDIQGS